MPINEMEEKASEEAERIELEEMDLWLASRE